MTSLPPIKPDNISQQQSIPLWKKHKGLLKGLSLKEIPRNVAWERRRRLKLMQEKKEGAVSTIEELSEDLNELKGCIELGFGFNEDESGQRLTSTLPALDIYFAVNRLGSPTVSPIGNGPTSPVPKLDRIGSLSSKSGESPVSNEDSWKICNPGLSVVPEVANGGPYQVW